MSFLKEQSIRDAIVVHVVFAVMAAAVVLLPVTAAVGWKLLLLVIVYNVMIPVVGYLRRHLDWLGIWFFVFLISIMQVVPDWFLSAQLDVLVFPVDGSPMIGVVPLYMAGLWSIPLFVLVYAGCRIEEKRSQVLSLAVVMLLSFVTFWLAEETMWMLPSWHAQNVATIGHVALYIIGPEVLLGASAYTLYALVRESSHWRKFFWAYITMVIYLGNVALFYFLIQRILLGT